MMWRPGVTMSTRIPNQTTVHTVPAVSIGICAAAAGRTVARYLAAVLAALGLGATTALAQCTSTGATFGGNLAFLPFGTGSAVSSIVSTVNSVSSGSLAQSTAFVGVPANATTDMQNGGRWARVIGGNIETKAEVVTNGLAVVSNGGVSLAEITSTNCNTTTSQDFIGTQAGMDIGRANFAGGGNINWGVTAGYTDITSKDKTPGLGTFKADTHVPFAGLYVALSAGNLAIDAQVRGDFIHSDISDVDVGAVKQPLTARSLAFLFNASYRMALADNWFIEPSIGGVSSITEVDKLSVVGGINMPTSVTQSLSLPGTLVVDDIHSLTGRASLRIGKTIITGGLALQPFLTASVFHEFASPIRSRIDPNLADIGTTGFFGTGIGDSVISRVGTYGHVGAGIGGLILNSGWLGYARADYRFGDNIDSFTVNAGFRYQFQPNDIAASLKDDGHDGAGHHRFNWTGLYAGTTTGALWGSQDQSFTPGIPAATPKFQGYLLGGQIGYNFQAGNLVLGVEGDYGFTNARGGSACPNAVFFSCVAEMDTLALITGRVGLAHQRALYYVKGGIAIGEVATGYEQNGGGLSAVASVPGDIKTETLTGWTFGAGMEYAVTDKWSVKGEWMHFDLGKENYDLSFPMQSTTSGDIARIGVSYHFGGLGSGQ